MKLFRIRLQDYKYIHVEANDFGEAEIRAMEKILKREEEAVIDENGDLKGIKEIYIVDIECVDREY